MTPRNIIRTRVLCVCLAALLTFAYGAYAQLEGAMKGDVNRDGACNVLDVQAMVAQALNMAARVGEADIDGDGNVNILDIQNAVATSLQAGGLVQRVEGRAVAGDGVTLAQIRVRAVSREGLSIEQPVDPTTGRFRLCLRTNTAWALAFFANVGGEGQARTGVVEFPVEEATTILLPVAELSKGQALDLGQLQFQNRVRTQADIRTMLARMARRCDGADDNADGLPDFLEGLVDRALNAPGVPQGMDGQNLHERIAGCLAAWLEDVTAPSLTDTDSDGIPDFVEPLIDCLRGNTMGWLDHQGFHCPDRDDDHDGVPDFIEAVIDYIVAGLPAWLDNLDNPELVDADADGIPDYLEPYLDVPSGPNALDPDGNGTPQYAQDADGDGIPNCLDPDACTPADCDGDGIPNLEDLDCDNDGVPNYADADPSDPNVQ